MADIPPQAIAPGGRPGLRGLDRHRALGYLFALLTAICWSLSPIFLRKGLDIRSDPLLAVTVGMVAATVPYLVWLVAVPPTPPLPAGGYRSAAGRYAMRFMVLSGLAGVGGAVARTYAIDLAPIVVVVPLLQTTGVWSVMLSPFLMGRRVEHVTSKLVFGTLLVAAGAALVIVGQNV